MADDHAGDAGLLSRVAGRLETDEGRQLFDALVQAHARGGPRAVKDLIGKVLIDAREPRLEDAHEADTNDI